ncbi:hypothetical protein C8R46DRAFT_1262434 [Mycena filopes]|nr:hypothetical protein C8R46DRAFT_1262434 [Mycena filopes]
MHTVCAGQVTLSEAFIGADKNVLVQYAHCPKQVKALEISPAPPTQNSTPTSTGTPTSSPRPESDPNFDPEPGRTADSDPDFNPEPESDPDFDPESGRTADFDFIRPADSDPDFDFNLKPDCTTDFDFIRPADSDPDVDPDFNFNLKPDCTTDFDFIRAPDSDPAHRRDTTCFTPSGGGPDPSDCAVVADALLFESQNIGPLFTVGTETNNTVVMQFASCLTFFRNQDVVPIEYCRSDWSSLVNFIAPNCQATQNAHGGLCVATNQQWFAQVNHS